MKRISILFVCMGNICRSPLAEGIFGHLVAEAGLTGDFTIDPAGTGGWHEGEPPDRRSIATAKAHGIDISGIAVMRLRASRRYLVFSRIVAGIPGVWVPYHGGPGGEDGELMGEEISQRRRRRSSWEDRPFRQRW